MWMLRFAFGVTSIALFEPGDRFSGRNDWLVGVIRIGGADNWLLPAKPSKTKSSGMRVFVIMFFLPVR